MDAYDDYYDAAKKDGEPVIQGKHGGCIDNYRPSTVAAFDSNSGQEHRERVLTGAYGDGRADEREQWLPLAGELRARILHKHQPGWSLVLTLEDVLAISCELKRAERQS